MPSRPTESNYRSLAEFRYQIRLFMADSDETARSAGLEPEQYQLLLAVRGMPQGSSATIQRLASRLLVRHNTAVERVDRLARMRLLRRTHSSTDQRVVSVELSVRGKRIVEKLAHKRVQDLRRTGHELIAALAKVISTTRSSSKTKG